MPAAPSSARRRRALTHHRRPRRELAPGLPGAPRRPSRGAERSAALAHGWTFAIHRTDRPATELLLALHARMGEGRAGAGRRRATSEPAEPA